MIKERSKLRKVSQESYAILIKALLEEELSSKQLAEISGLHVVTVRDLMRIFKRHKLIHISDWEPDIRGRDCTAVFKWGKGRDCPRRTKSNAQRQAEFRARQQCKDILFMTCGKAPPPRRKRENKNADTKAQEGLQARVQTAES